MARAITSAARIVSLLPWLAMTLSIPFNRPHVAPEALAYLQQAVGSPRHSGDGPFTQRCHRLLSGHLGGADVLLTTSCTHALEMAALLLDIGPGDEVIVPSFTFVSTANAFALRGAKLVFADIREDTLNLDERRLEGLITPQTKAIVPVHYAGVGCEMDGISRIANRHGVSVVEDAAHGLFGSYRGRPLGTIGELATFSFHETKNLSCGEGGALVINDPRLLERAEVIREKGTNRSQFFRGEVDKYSWVDLGSSYLLSDLLAAVLAAQIEAAEDTQARRERIWRTYDRELAAWADHFDIRRPIVPEHCRQPWHMYYLLMPSPLARTAFIRHLQGRDVQASFHYLPLHLSDYGRRCGGRPGDCPVTEEMSDRLVRLPIYPEMSETDLRRVTDACREFSLPRTARDRATTGRPGHVVPLHPRRRGVTVAGDALRLPKRA